MQLLVLSLIVYVECLTPRLTGIFRLYGRMAIILTRARRAGWWKRKRMSKTRALRAGARWSTTQAGPIGYRLCFWSRDDLRYARPCDAACIAQIITNEVNCRPWIDTMPPAEELPSPNEAQRSATKNWPARTVISSMIGLIADPASRSSYHSRKGAPSQWLDTQLDVMLNS